MAKRPAKYSDEYFVKALDPRDADTKYMGEGEAIPAKATEGLLRMMRDHFR